MEKKPDREKSINRIVLVGNGFDIAHGFNVSFKAFIENLIIQTINDFKKGELEHNNFLSICYLEGSPRVNFASTFEETKPFLKLKEYESRSSHFRVTKSDLFKAIEQEYAAASWVDLETIYFNLLTEYVIKRKSHLIQTLNSQMSFLSSKLEQFLCENIDLKGNSINHQLYSQFIQVIYGKSDITKNGWADSQKPNQYLFLNFNYTAILKLYFDALSDPVKFESDYVHIHGILRGDDAKTGQKIVFGYGDEKHEKFLNFEQYNAPKEAFELIKSYKYLEAREYQKVIRFLSLAPYQVSIFGHSCGQSDRTLLRTMFNHKNCVSIKPYYYLDEHEKDDYFDKALAISMCFDDNENFRETLVNKKDCEPMVQVPHFNKAK